MGAVSATGLFSQGEQLLEQCKLDEAVQLLTCLLADTPQHWQARAARGRAYYQLKQYDKSLDDYYEALALQPNSPNLKCNLAVLLKELGQLDIAEHLLREVLEAVPDHLAAWSNLGVLKHYQLDYTTAIHCHEQAIRLGNHSAASWNNMGQTLTSATFVDQAIHAYQRALQLDASLNIARFNLAIALFMAGRYREAWSAYEARWDSVLVARYTTHRWKGQPLGTATLLIWTEQGLGDTLQMVRCLARIQQAQPNARIVLACPPSFHRLFSCLADIECVDIAVPITYFDWQIPLMSLGACLQLELTTLPAVPYLMPDKTLIQHWATCISHLARHTKRVGIVWETGTWGTGIVDHSRQNKSIPYPLFQTLLHSMDCDFFSLQLTPPPEHRADWGPAPYTLPIRDFADTAAIIANLDLVISVDTSVVHLAGAMGKPVWILMRYEDAPFLGIQGERTPWYPSAHIIRQSSPGNWHTVIEQTQQRLAAAWTAS